MIDPTASPGRQAYGTDFVTPAQAGVHDPIKAVWIPARSTPLRARLCAGMTEGAASPDGSQASMPSSVQGGPA